MLPSSFNIKMRLVEVHGLYAIDCTNIIITGLSERTSKLVQLLRVRCDGAQLAMHNTSMNANALRM